jgi:hypothetical protein
MILSRYVRARKNCYLAVSYIYGDLVRLKVDRLKNGKYISYWEYGDDIVEAISENIFDVYCPIYIKRKV